MPQVLIIIGIILIAGICYLLKIKTAVWPYCYYKHTVKIQKDIAYLDDGNPKHKLDIYLPKDKASFPLVIFIHGGYWVSGDRRYHTWITGLYASVGIFLARAGYGVIIPSYRLGKEITISDQLEDVSSVIKWTVTNSDSLGASNKLIIMGHSAGGHIASLLTNSHFLQEKYGIEPKTITGCLALSPILNVVDMIKNANDNFKSRVYWPIFSRSIENQKIYSPDSYLTHLPLVSTPQLVLVGERDIKTIRRNAQVIVKASQGLGLNIKYMEISGLSHSQMMTSFGSPKNPPLSEVLSFLETI
jgi:acetyl esterase/lipase